MSDEGRPPKLSTLLIVGVGSYDDPKLDDRPQVETAAQALAETFASASHVRAAPHLIGAPKAEEVITAVTDWATDLVAERPRTGLLLWTGHADINNYRRPGLFTADRRLEPEAIGDALTSLAQSGMRDWVVVLDCCYGYSAGRPIFERLDEMAGQTEDSRIAVITSTDDLNQAHAGRFTSTMAEVLRRGPEEGWWSFSDDYVEWDAFVKRLEESLVDPPMPRTGGRRPGRIIPNPLYRAKGVVGSSFDEEHFLPKALGIEAGESGWYFTGRHQVLQELLDWLHIDLDGIYVVTGSAGTGKSAILGRLITLSVEAYRAIAPSHVLADAPAPDVGDIQLAFHARERRVEDLLAFLANGLGLTTYHDVSDLYEPLRLASEARIGRPYVIAVDALDEAMGNHGRRMVNEVLTKIGIRPGVKVLIGSRPGVVDWERLISKGEPIRVYDLDRDQQTRADITDYVARRLPRIKNSTYADAPPETLRTVARAVADASITVTPKGLDIGSFLVARVISKTLASAPPVNTTVDGWESDLPQGLEAAFEADLAAYGARHDPSVEQLIRDLLEGLAWDEGQGIPRRHIPIFTRAATNRDYGDEDITTLLALAGGHVTEIEQDGWAMYRLYHERFREHLRDATRQRRANGSVP